MCRPLKIVKVIKILKSKGIRMNIGGCGCCGSPWVSFEYKGKLIVDDLDDFNIVMIEEKE